MTTPTSAAASAVDPANATLAETPLRLFPDMGSQVSNNDRAPRLMYKYRALAPGDPAGPSRDLDTCLGEMRAAVIELGEILRAQR